MQKHLSTEAKVNPKPQMPKETTGVARSILGRGSKRNKPRGAGFWTASDIGVWKQVLEGREFVHGFEVVGDPDLLVLETPKQVETTTEYFRAPGGDRWEWKSIAKAFDAVRARGRALNTEMLRLWDHESTLWFNTSHLKHKFTKKC